MTLILELPKEIEEKLDELARAQSTTREEVALRHLSRLEVEAPVRRRQLKSWGMLAGSGISSEHIHRDRREEVARELGEIP